MDVKQIDTASQGLTVGVRYNKTRHRTEFTVRKDGKIIDDNHFNGEMTESEIQKMIADIKRQYQ